MGLSYQLGAHPQDLLSVCSVLPRLEALGLNRSRDQDSGPYGHLSGPSLWAIFSLIPNSVRMLQLSGYGLGIEEEAHARDREEATEKELKSVPPPLPPQRCHTGKITSLILMRPNCPPAVSEHLVRWPAALEEIAIKNGSGAEKDKHFSIPVLESLFEIQKFSLRYIYIELI